MMVRKYFLLKEVVEERIVFNVVNNKFFEVLNLG